MQHFPRARNAATPRRVIATAALVGGLVVLGALGSGSVAAQRAGRPLPTGIADQGGTLWTLATPLDDGRQMLLVVDQQNRGLAIYHVDPASGTLTLKSTRDIRWDLMVEDFNAQEPKPSALRTMLGKMPEVPK